MDVEKTSRAPFHANGQLDRGGSGMIEGEEDCPATIHLSYTKNQKGKVANFAFGSSIRCGPPKPPTTKNMLAKMPKDIALSRTEKLRV